MSYKIIRFRFNKPQKVIKRGLTLEEAKRHCSSEKTHKLNKDGSVVWFDGFTKEKKLRRMV